MSPPDTMLAQARAGIACLHIVPRPHLLPPHPTPSDPTLSPPTNHIMMRHPTPPSPPSNTSRLILFFCAIPHWLGPSRRRVLPLVLQFRGRFRLGFRSGSSLGFRSGFRLGFRLGFRIGASSSRSPCDFAARFSGFGGGDSHPGVGVQG
jgi:hypothetical protein